MTRPTDDQLAAIRAGAKHDLDNIIDTWPTMIEAAATRYRHNQPPQPEAIGRQQGTHSDPTGAQAFQPNPAQQWIDQARRTLRQLHTLTAQIVPLLGEPVCPQCDQPLAGRDTKRLGGVPHHDGACYLAAYRAAKEAA